MDTVLFKVTVIFTQRCNSTCYMLTPYNRAATATVGVPVIAPVDVFKDNPAGGFTNKMQLVFQRCMKT
jgi:hypothetical protein